MPPKEPEAAAATDAEDAAPATPTPVSPEGDTPAAANDAEMTAFLADDSDSLDDVGEEVVGETEAPVADAPTDVSAPTDESQGKAEEGKPEAEAKEEEPKPEAPVGEAAAAPTPEVKAGEKPAEPPTPEQRPAVTPEAEAAAAPKLSAEEVAAEYRAWRGGVESDLAAKHFVINDELAEELDNDPRTAIPKMMSRVYMDAVISAIGHIQANMPALVDSALRTRDATDASEANFFKAWPGLNGSEHREVINRLGTAYRQMYPNATEPEFIRDVGAQAMIALKVPMGEPEAPQASETPTAPFKPAGQSAPRTGAPASMNPFDKLDQDFAEEELDLD